MSEIKSDQHITKVCVGTVFFQIPQSRLFTLTLNTKKEKLHGRFKDNCIQK